MKAICYRNTKITLPNWVPNSRLNEECPLGFAYEDGDFYVHIYIAWVRACILFFQDL